MPKGSTLTLLVIVATLLQLASPPSFSAPESQYVAIIIDDIGHNHRRGKQLIDIPADLTFSIIPDSTHSHRLARYAHESGKEVMVHLPMANARDHPMSRIALTRGLLQDDYPLVIEDALERVPFARGLNNHMGSYLTQEPEAMSWLMDSMKGKGMFFVDSRTTPDTVASSIASKKNVLSASRDVFLDNERTPYAIDRQFRYLLRLAKKQKTAIAIGHPYPSTIDYLSNAIPLLKQENIQVVSVSKVIQMRLATRQVAANY